MLYVNSPPDERPVPEKRKLSEREPDVGPTVQNASLPCLLLNRSLRTRKRSGKEERKNQEKLRRGHGVETHCTHVLRRRPGQRSMASPHPSSLQSLTELEGTFIVDTVQTTVSRLCCRDPMPGAAPLTRL